MMINPVQLEAAYKEFSVNFNRSLPDGIIPVSLSLFHELGLLNHSQFEQSMSTDQLTHYFHVIETEEKVTLFNDQFAVWIVPKLVDEQASTMTFIALLHDSKPHLELVFSTSGVYNTPKYILKVLQHFLSEVIDTEKIISSIDNKKPPEQSP